MHNIRVLETHLHKKLYVMETTYNFKKLNIFPITIYDQFSSIFIQSLVIIITGCGIWNNMAYSLSNSNLLLLACPTYYYAIPHSYRKTINRYIQCLTGQASI